MTLSIWQTLGGTKSEVSGERHTIFPSSKAPKKPTSLYERDEIEDIEKWMMSRAYLLEQAYSITALLSISILPIHPDTRQTWFQSNVVKQLVLGEKPPYFTQESRISQKAANPESMVVHGFLEPYPTFSSDLGLPDHRFKQIVPSLIASKLDIAAHLGDVGDYTLRLKLQRILEIFLEDDEAGSIALRFHSLGTPFLKIFQKA